MYMNSSKEIINIKVLNNSINKKKEVENFMPSTEKIKTLFFNGIGTKSTHIYIHKYYLL